MKRLATVTFSCTSLLSATLLFAVQPLVGKMVLPVFGGAPAVWNTCMVFFQLLLLAGYLYSHLLVARVAPRTQAAAHLALLLAALAALPIAMAPGAAEAAGRSSPILGLLGLLAGMAALPYFVVSATAPLLQAWFARLDHPDAHDPYFLYASSNLGSLAALLAYPFLIEPRIGVALQSLLWSGGLLVLAVCIAACAALLLRGGRALPAAFPLALAAPAVGWGTRARWILLAAIPSSLVLGVTTYLTTDLGSLPLLWVVPLALYLLTFVVAFGRRTRVGEGPLRRIATVATVALAFVFLVGATQPTWLIFSLHLGAFFVLALYCHATLAELRPEAARLTDFYLCLSIGGVLGGAFNALLAPLLFTNVLEYPLVAVAVLGVRPLVDRSQRPTLRDLALAGGLAAATAALGVLLSRGTIELRDVAARLLVGLPVVGCYLLAGRPARFALATVGVVVASAATFQLHGRTLHVDRDFYGTSRVTIDPSGRFVQLVHGNTVHGRQARDDTDDPTPLTYFHPYGPAGQLFRVFNEARPDARVAVIGLGTGSMAHFAGAHQSWRYFEIDPAIVAIARDRGFFGFLAASAAKHLDVVLGDARIRIREEPDASFDMIVIDAFSSDSIPAHLVTREAVELYRSKLSREGLIAFHISNRYFDLRPVLGRIAEDLSLQSAVIIDSRGPDWDERFPGREPSLWVLLAAPSPLFDHLLRRSGWVPMRIAGDAPLWTDDYSSALSVMHW